MSPASDEFEHWYTEYAHHWRRRESRHTEIERVLRSFISAASEGQATIRSIASGVTLIKIAVEAPESCFACFDRERLHQLARQLHVANIQVVPWSDDQETLIRNALAPLVPLELLHCDAIGRVIAITAENQRSRNESIPLACKIVHLDIEVMSRSEYESQVAWAREDFTNHPAIDERLAAELVSLGFLSRDDLSVIDPDLLARLGHLDLTQVASILQWCESDAQHD